MKVLCLLFFTAFSLQAQVYDTTEVPVEGATDIPKDPRANARVELLPKQLAPENDTFFTFGIENDVVADTDRGYTNGARFALLLPENDLPVPAQFLLDTIPLISPQSIKRVTLDFGQSLYTPENITASALITDDRPYAGWLYGSLGINADSGNTFDQLKLTLGVVGPSALGEPTQKIVHKWTNSPDPKGWDNQLHDELGVILTYNKAWKQSLRSEILGFGVDFTPHAGFSLGNVFTHAAAGGTIRLGFDLPQDYGPPVISPGLTGSDFFVPTDNFGWYLFATAEGRAVGRNIFLDGNTFKDSHSVDRKYLVYDTQLGLALTYKTIRIAYTHVFRSKEFRGQEEADSYGGLTTTFRF